MITITRRQARGLRGVFRRAALGITHRRPVPPLLLHAGDAQLRAQYRYAGLALEHAAPGPYLTAETVALPLDALADVEGRDESAVVIESLAPDRTAVRWDDRGVPQTREYTVPPPGPMVTFPEHPPCPTEVSTGLLDALAEATATGAEEDTRYALSCILMTATTGAVVATDGRQLLVRGGFAFPWDGDVLVRRSPVFASRALPRDRPASLARTDTHVVLQAGAWTLWLEIQAKARFPRIEHVIPDPSAVTTRLRLDGGDAAFLARVLDRLPGGDVANGPVTVDLNGRVAVRARASAHGPVTELVLARSGYTGAPVRVSTNRGFLARAVRLGFTAVEVVDADSPLVCRDGPRVYAWQPLSKESAIDPGDDVTRVESCPSNPPPADGPEMTANARDAMSESNEKAGDQPGPDDHPGDTVRAGDTAAPGQVGPGLAALVAEAEALHAALADARTRAGRLTAALRRHRKKERLVDATLASLRALKLDGVSV